MDVNILKLWVQADRLPLSEIFSLLGHSVSHDPPCSIACPVHKGGQEQKPSARWHLDNHVYCFVCNKQYTPSMIISQRRAMTRTAAAQFLIQTYAKHYPQLKDPVNEEDLDFFQNSSYTTHTNFEKRALSFIVSTYRNRSPLLSYRSFLRQLLFREVTLHSEEQYRSFLNRLRISLET